MPDTQPTSFQEPLTRPPSMMAWSFEQYGAEDGGGTPEKFAEFIRSEQQKWARVVKDAKVQVDA